MPGKRLRSESPCQLGQPFGQEVGDNVSFGRQLDLQQRSTHECGCVQTLGGGSNTSGFDQRRVELHTHGADATTSGGEDDASITSAQIHEKPRRSRTPARRGENAIDERINYRRWRGVYTFPVAVAKRRNVALGPVEGVHGQNDLRLHRPG